MMELMVEDLPTSIRDVKEAQAELARVLKEYIDARIDCRLVEGDPEYSGFHEREALKKAEAQLDWIITRAK